MTDRIENEAAVLLLDGKNALTAERPMKVCSVTVEWTVRAGKLTPRVTVVLEPRD
ncbi:MAG TPA: hypothetical protein VMG14_01395 [Thermoplasmata archaeon]|nr:hypothetical protein [Thermoplasmata archaeon]HTW76407.1 hypothetical protein [Thermoplasmata archaeon]